ncbi:MAG: hypothetical protein M0T73_00505 [Deltaproteobacteria bacterium]|nr:hypothetical protein [Deltaproteobacteria bacterium]
MRKKFMALISGALSLAFVMVPGASRWAQGQAGYDYNTSSLMQSPSGEQNGQMPQAYYPYWTNYLDNLQRDGGYYSVTGNYGSSPVTSYYPANPSNNATSPQVTSQSGMYYNPQDYYGSQQQGYQQPPQASPYQSYQAPAASLQTPVAQGKKASKKHKPTTASIQSQQPDYYGQQQPGYAPQQQAYGQSPNYPQQQAYGQYQQQPSGQESPPAYGSDPSVQAAQQKAYERAVARQKAAELAAQQQSAMQELQQTQQMYVAAQQKLREQEQKQKELQNEYHKKAVGEAYESLRAAQQRYYDLMGVSGENAGQAQAGQTAVASQQALPQQPTQYPQAAQAQPPQAYPQSMPAASYGNPAMPQASYPGSAGVNTGAAPPMAAPSAYPPGQATPLQVQQPQQQAQQESSGGFWGTLKEIFSPPTTGPVPNQRSMWENQKPKSLGE